MKQTHPHPARKAAAGKGRSGPPKARADTLGQNVVFQNRHDAPDTGAGRHWLGHELTQAGRQNAANAAPKRRDQLCI
ncbi:MAG: DUF4157 domain-containing protein [Ardenticatenaceae bacterium]|nr:DUF4157 domain-containing protein [Ardenticatenaceae bacterium]